MEENFQQLLPVLLPKLFAVSAINIFKVKNENKLRFFFAAKSVPFNIRFLSDLYETDAEKAVNLNGFRLSYTMKSC